MCGGFSCSKNTLVGINVVYVMVAFLLIGVATYAKTSSIVVTLPIVGGMVACGVFLLFVAVLGLIATIKHHQVMLFFYMMILFVIFVIQFSVACACIGVNLEQEKKMSRTAWEYAEQNEIALVRQAQTLFQCCGYDINDTAIRKDDALWCQQHIDICKPLTTTTAADSNSTKLTLDCITCSDKIDSKMDKGFNAVGGLGLFFSLTEIIGAVIAYRYRNLMPEQPAAAMFS